MYLGSPELAVHLAPGKQRYRNIAIRELAPVEHKPQVFAETPRVTVDGLINGAAAHMEEMLAKGMPVSRRHAIDQVLRAPGRPQIDRLGRFQPAPDFDVDPAVAMERRKHRVPHFIDPEQLFLSITKDTNIPQSADRGPSIDNIEMTRDRRIAHGASPIEAHYQASIDLVLADWQQRDEIQAAEVAAEAAREAEVASRRSLAAWQENLRERKLDKPRGFGQK